MSALTEQPRWVFLDRDGTINVKPPPGEYVTSPEQLQLLPGAAAAIRGLNDAGIWVGVITNQRGIALGRMSEHDLLAVHDRLREELRRGGAHVDAIYVCPHEAGTCDCRKPLPGLLLQAQRDITGMDFARAVVIGDSDMDVQAGRAVGAATVLLAAEHRDYGEADRTEPSLAAAAGRLLAAQASTG
jgi:D-glycero-D-manno-heptose 1,7-bisphosphate phosphatase